MRAKSVAEKDIAPRVVCLAPWRVAQVKPLPNYKLSIEFVDGMEGTVDLSQLIAGKEAGIFALLRNVILFNQVYLEYGAVTWPGGIDLAPDAMYDEIKHHGQWILPERKTT